MSEVGRLFGELCGTWAHYEAAAVVIGGGPSAPASLERLKLAGLEPAVVLSANEHGFHQDVFPVTHSVCCDGQHGEKHVKMEKLLHALGPHAPIITPGHFGDYRLPEWNVATNTGLTAIAVAVFMGCAPVIVVGIDFYRWGGGKNAGTYFHDPKAVSNSNTKREVNFTSQIQALQQCVGARAPVRPMSGKLLEHYPPWMPHERVRPALPPKAKYLRSLPTCIVQCRPFPPFSFKLMNVEPGRVFPMSPNEARGATVGNGVKLIETHPAPDGSPLKLPAELLRAPRGYLPAIAKRDSRG